jgi:hypothetical protein
VFRTKLAQVAVSRMGVPAASTPSTTMLPPEPLSRTSVAARPNRSPWGRVAMRWLVSPISSQRVVWVPLPSLSRQAVRLRWRSGPSPVNRADRVTSEYTGLHLARLDAMLPGSFSPEEIAVVPSLRLLLLAALCRVVPAAAQVEAQVFAGSSVNLPSPLHIVQDGQPDIDLTGHWATRPFQDTPYYGARLALWHGDRGWLLDFTHHKMYLTNPPAEVQFFRITNGLNMVTVSRGFRHGDFSYAFGAGPVFTFPVTRVRGRENGGGRGFWGGYFLSGATLMASATRRVPVAGPFFFSLDGRASASYVRIPVGGGHASVPNVALHLHVGVGVGGGQPASATSASGRDSVQTMVGATSPSE